MSTTVQTRSRRQAGLTALYLGLFATVWFSVPSAGGLLRTLFVVASVAALLTAIAGFVVVARAGRAGPAGRDRAAHRRYLLIVVAEFASAGIGAVLLSAADRPEYVPVLVATVVGVHFFPLVHVLHEPHLRLLGVVVCAVALAGLITGLTTGVAAGLVAATGTGLALLGYAVTTLAGSLRRG
ncbi:hypothetical protein [Actinoplanes auranticolor]|uniref:hypothetical protein n=1 Tax=Actinoplanes auranticolor TaxID=47988 RepID=UPI001BB3BA1E|nr:hypothetical protein [Actinoplanes auranticolor]